MIKDDMLRKGKILIIAFWFSTKLIFKETAVLKLWGGLFMPAKGTKKIRGHTRKKYLINDPLLKIEDPFAKRTRVKTHFRSKPKKRK